MQQNMRKTDPETIRALVRAIYAITKVWPTEREISALVGGTKGNKKDGIGKIIAECKEQDPETPQNLFNALALLEGYRDPQHAKNKLTELANRGHARQSINELRAAAAIKSPHTDTRNLTRKELLTVLQAANARTFTSSIPHNPEVEQAIKEQEERRREKSQELLKEADADRTDEVIQSIVARVPPRNQQATDS